MPSARVLDWRTKIAMDELENAVEEDILYNPEPPPPLQKLTRVHNTDG